MSKKIALGSRDNSPRQVIKARSDVLTFGQYKDVTIQSVLDDDPSYLLWLHFEKGIVKLPQDIVDQAQAEDERRSGHS